MIRLLLIMALWLPPGPNDPVELIDDPIVDGLVFAGLGHGGPGTDRYPDWSGRFSDGELKPNAATGPQWVFENGRWAVRFDGTNAVNCGNQSTLSPTSMVTVAAWVDTTSFVGATTVAGKWQTGGATNNSYLLYGSGSVRFTVQQSNTVIREVAAAAPSDGLHHIAGMADGANLSIYIDGAIASSLVSYDGTIHVSTADFEIGRFSGNFPMVGDIADPLIYNRALSPSEIAWHADPTNRLLRSQLDWEVPRKAIVPPQVLTPEVATSQTSVVDPTLLASRSLSVDPIASQSSVISPDLIATVQRHLGGRATVTPALRGRILRFCLGGSVQHVPRLRGRVIANPQD